MVRRLRSIILVTTFVALGVVVPTSAQASNHLLRATAITRPRTQLPHLRPQIINHNPTWSGYADLAHQGTKMRSIVAKFNIPFVNCAQTPGAYSTDWVGLDGYSNNTVEQVGTDSDCNGPTPSYDAFYEMFPRGPAFYVGVRPGDAIKVSVRWNGDNTYSLALTDLTTSGSFAVTKRCPSGHVCHNKSAEVVTEDDSDLHNANDLADFGVENYTGAAVTTSAGAHGTLAAKRGYWSSLEDDHGRQARASPR